MLRAFSLDLVQVIGSYISSGPIKAGSRPQLHYPFPNGVPRFCYALARDVRGHTWAASRHSIYVLDSEGRYIATLLKNKCKQPRIAVGEKHVFVMNSAPGTRLLAIPMLSSLKVTATYAGTQLRSLYRTHKFDAFDSHNRRILLKRYAYRLNEFTVDEPHQLIFAATNKSNTIAVINVSDLSVERELSIRPDYREHVGCRSVQVTGIALSPSGSLIVSRGAQVLEVDRVDGSELRTFVFSGFDWDKPMQPAVNRWGQVLILEYWYQMVRVFEADGTFVTSFHVSAVADGCRQALLDRVRHMGVFVDAEQNTVYISLVAQFTKNYRAVVLQAFEYETVQC